MGNGTIKIPVIQWAIDTAFNPQPLQLNLTAELLDSDSDSDTDSFSINLASALATALADANTDTLL